MKFNAILRLAFLAAWGMAIGSQVAAAAVHGDDAKKAAAALDKAGKPTAVKEPLEASSWASSLNEGYRRALSDRKPLLILVTAKWCVPCRKLAGELETAAVQAELARWTPVRLDFDAQTNDANELAVSGVPALRIRTSGGLQVAGRDGYLSAGELIEWLRRNYDAAVAAADDVLLGSGEPSITAVVRLVKQFQQRNPALREAAIRRLLPYPNAARSVVLKIFREGSLAARLAALEVLAQWKAPLGDLDPWRPETFTPERLARLEQWQSHEAVGSQPSPKRLSEEQRIAARRQIERMLGADEAEADAIRQRLASLGATLLPEVYARLKDAATDQDRRRLLILRYRLVAPDSLVLRWSGGLERLGDTDPHQRRQAADELAKLAGEGEKSLLLELFADTDPVVREISLRGLQHIGGKEANTALVKLLGDPEPNVRAAVLKQLEETPDGAMTPAVVKYLKEEKDPDLIVHGIRFLQATKGSEALRCLMSLLKHKSWQVRAEAAAGIGKLGGEMNHPGLVSSSAPAGHEDAGTKLLVDAYVALLDLLDDDDAFVVTKAVEGLSNADMAVAVEPLVKTAGKHPDLAASVLTMLAAGNKMRQKAIPHLRKFCKHEQPRVRAAAIAALCVATSDDVAEQLVAALGDKQTEVRIAAASSLFKLLDTLRREAKNRALSGAVSVSPSVVVGAGMAPPIASEGLVSSVVQFFTSALRPAKPSKPKPPSNEKPGKDTKAADKKGKPDAAKPEDNVNPQDQWLKDYYAGKHRPKWTSQMIAPLEKMLPAKDPKERVAAALALAPLGKAAVALPVLGDTVRATPDLLETAQAVLPWLSFEQRLKTFRDFRSLAASKESLARLIEAFSEASDRRTAEPLWELLADAKVAADEARALQMGLAMAYVGNRYFSPSAISPADRRELAKAAKARIMAGSDWQRLVALSLLVAASPDEAAGSAARLADDPKLSASLRTDAFRIQLLTQSRKQSRKTVLAAIRGTDGPRKKVALQYLVQGSNGLRVLPSGIFLSGNFDVSFDNVRQNGTPIIPTPPVDIAIEDIRPLAGNSDPELAACAGYLLALLGEPDGIRPLLQYWRQHGQRHDEWKRLVYRAIAVIDDPQYIPVLREIYGQLDEYEFSEFYWTIRIMSGPEILKFRKQIRAEVGASRLSS